MCELLYKPDFCAPPAPTTPIPAPLANKGGAVEKSIPIERRGYIRATAARGRQFAVCFNFAVTIDSSSPREGLPPPGAPPQTSISSRDFEGSAPPFLDRFCAPLSTVASRLCPTSSPSPKPCESDGELPICRRLKFPAFEYLVKSETEVLLL